MERTRSGSSGKKVVALRAAAPVPEPPEPLAVPSELVIGGRRFKLVPAEDLEDCSAEARFGPAAEMLTERELQIASLVAEGMVNKQIADKLAISEYTVATHLRRMFAKLGVDTRASMISRCMAKLDK
jgi:DNA-binding NarL/FixJ family response regulator